MSSNIIDLQQQIEEARRRKAEAEAAEQARLAEQAKYQREIAEADAAEKAALGAQAALELAGKAKEAEELMQHVERWRETINKSLDKLLAVIEHVDGGDFQLTALIVAFEQYEQNRSLYGQAYQELRTAHLQAKNAYPGADFSEAENTLKTLGLPQNLPNGWSLLAQWLDTNTPKDQLGRSNGTPATVDAVCALVAAMLKRGGKYGVKKFFDF